MSSNPRDIRSRSPGTSPSGSPLPSSHSRNVSIARLASPVPASPHLRSPPVSQVPTPAQIAADKQAELPAIENPSSLPGPGHSALAAALARSQDRGNSPTGTPSRRAPSPAAAGLGSHDRVARSNYGSFDTREATSSPVPFQDPEIVRRHLVQPDNTSGRYGSPLRTNVPVVAQGLDSDEFSSLRLQGGDITRPIYRYAEGNDIGSGSRAKRSLSFNVSRPEPESEVLDINNIKVPGGFRRNFLRRAADDPEVPIQIPRDGLDGVVDSSSRQGRPQPQLFTNNFLEFLTLYGHFAGEDLEEDDEVLEPDEYFSSDAWEDHGYGGEASDGEPGEGSTLLTPGTAGRRKRKHKERGTTGNNSSFNAALLLLKSFVGTGVLFLPRAYLNGGMLFSNLVLLGVACLSYYCFILLVNTRLKVVGSFGDIGGALYGKYMRTLILSSIVLSQVGFVSAYIVFTAENLQAFVLAVSKCKEYIDIKFMVLMQLVVFLPLSLIRDIGKLGFTALIADVFIMLGLLYLYYYDIATIVDQGGVSDIKAFNPSTWTLFIGTAIFTFEGVGLIIPIQESMRQPSKFPGVLAIVMVIITTLFVSIGAFSYAAYGSHTQTVVILNLPQDDKFVNAVQFLYSLAILLSTPLQLFPAIRIMENELFTRSGKYNPYIKWQKNAFRFCLVVICAMIAWGGAGDLDKFVALVGSFACVPLVYVYPPLLHLKAVARKPWQRIADYAVCCFGVVGCAYTTVLSIYLWAGASAPKQPGYCDS
jgi:solute carrier family 36 (proton-coupled amino acid transporter)